MPTDYTKLLDEETWAFVNKTFEYYPEDTVGMGIEDQRRVYDAMCREFFSGYPKGVSAEDRVIDAPHPVPVRCYSVGQGEAAATVVYAHGGGFVVGGLESHDDVCAEICARTSFDVVSVDYRLAPENLHPAMFDDTLAAFRWVAENRHGPTVFCGDSAGGNLVAAAAHATRGEERQAVGQVLIYPGLGGDMTKGSYVTHAEAPMLNAKEVSFYSGIRTGGKEITGDPTYAPLQDTDFSGLPPTVLFSAECDPLNSDCGAYRDAIRAAGGEVEWIDEKGLVHGYLRGRKSVGRVARSFDRIVEAIARLGRVG